MIETQPLSIFCEQGEKISAVLEDLMGPLKISVVEKRRESWQLVLVEGRLGLGNQSLKLKPVFVDWLAPWRGKPLGKKDLFARAVAAGRLKSAVDATGGWGRDAARLLSLGFHLTVIEANPVMHLLLAAASEAAKSENKLWRERQLPRLNLILGDAKQVVPTLAPEKIDLIYLDPMYPDLERKAKAGAEMQLLQNFLAETVPPSRTSTLATAPEAAAKDLFDSLLPYCGRRLVMKRPRWAESVSEPQQTFEGKAVRYDVWIKADQKN